MEAMSLEKLMQKSVCTVDRSTTLVEAARQLMQHSVGALVITEPSEPGPVGIITDRDLVAMIAKGLDPKQTTVDWFAQPALETVRVDDALETVTHKMRESGVLNDGDTVVCTLTGHGLKDPDTAMSVSVQPLKVPADLAKIVEVMELMPARGGFGFLHATCVPLDEAEDD